LLTLKALRANWISIRMADGRMIPWDETDPPPCHIAFGLEGWNNSAAGGSGGTVVQSIWLHLPYPYTANSQLRTNNGN
jgi:hypothetical protein